MKLVAVVRVRGRNGVNKKVNDTLDMLRLYKQNSCTVVPSTPQYLGMLQKAKDYITWGEIDAETFQALLQKRGKVAGNKPLTEEYLKQYATTTYDAFVKDLFAFSQKLTDVPGLKPYFRLTPPAKGFERSGIKRPYAMGGALGYRRENINALLQRMI